MIDFTHTFVDQDEDGHLIFVFLRDIKGKTIGHISHSLILFKMDLLEGCGSKVIAEHHYKNGLPSNDVGDAA